LAGDPKMMPLLEEKKIIVTTAGSDVIPYSTAVTKNLCYVSATFGYTLQIRV